MRIDLPTTSRAAAGALPMLRAATDPAVPGGQFYGPRWATVGHPILETQSPRARDRASAQALWSASVGLTGLEPTFSR
jgi:hypothetical protein